MVIVEGRATAPAEGQEPYDAYKAKYDWSYSIDDYGPLTKIVPSTVLAWRAGGWAGRDGFQETGRWRFTSPGPERARPAATAERTRLLPHSEGGG